MKFIYETTPLLPTGGGHTLHSGVTNTISVSSTVLR